MFLTEDKKYEELKEIIKSLNPGDAVSKSSIKRMIKVGYHLAERFIEKLLEDGYIESYKQWVGTCINGIKTDGYDITLYRVPEKRDSL